MRLYTGTRKTIKRCPDDCRTDKFITTARIAQTWLIDTDGNFVKTLTNFNKIVRPPEVDSVRACSICKKEAVDVECTMFEIPRHNTKLYIPIDIKTRGKIYAIGKRGLTIITPDKILENLDQAEFTFKNIKYLAELETEFLTEFD